MKRFLMILSMLILSLILLISISTPIQALGARIKANIPSVAGTGSLASAVGKALGIIPGGHVN